jgi:hypothetical protein
MMSGALAVGVARPAACATAPPPDEAPAAAAASAADGDGEAKLTMFPIGLWGSLAYDFRALDASSADDAPAQRSLRHYLTAKLDGATYVWQPWFGNVKAGIGVTAGWSDFGADASPTRDLFLTGNARLQLFPRSTFPFEAYYEVTDTRIDGALIALPPARWTRAGLTQSYHASGTVPYSLSGRIEQSEQEGDATGRDVQQILDLSGEARWHNHGLSFTATANRNKRERTGEDAAFDSLFARHSYIPSADFTFESNANYTNSRYSGSLGAMGTRVLQYTGLGFWRPQEQPYTVTGTARLIAFDGEGGGEARSANATLGATYDASRNLRYTVNAGLGYATSPASNQGLYGASAGVSYVGDVVNFSDFAYNWSASTSLSVAGRSGGAGVRVDEVLGERGDEGSTLIGSGSITHSIGRTLALPRDQSIGGVLSQTLTAAKATDDIAGRDDALRLTTDLSVTYGAGSAAVNGYARLALTDSRSLVRSDSVVQMANLQVSGSWEFSRYSRLTGDLTAQWVRSELPPRPLLTPDAILEGGTRTATSGISANIAYRHQRLFGVPRLRFLSELRIADEAVLEQEERLLLPDRESLSWENRLDYLIGRLLFSLSLRVSEVNRNQTRSIMLRVQRDFEGVAFQ